MSDTIMQRLMELVSETAALHNEALGAKVTGREFSQRELRVRFAQLKRINADLGQVQFDIMNDLVWSAMDEEDREYLGGLIDDTIKGADMIAEVMSETP